jgi:hypothetical protein
MTDLEISDPKISTPKWFQPALLLVGILIGLISYHYFLPPVSDNDVENTVSRKTAVEINNGKTVHQSKPPTSSQGDPWEIIRELEDELELVLSELDELKASDEQRKLAELAKKERQRKQEELWRKEYTVEKRKENASRTAARVSNELKGYLELSSEEASALQVLLENKAHQVVDTKQLFLELSKESSEHDRKLIYERTRVEHAATQAEYESEVAKVLSEEQISKYLEFEKEKYQLRHKDTQRYISKSVANKIDNLTEFQKSEIDRHFKQKEAELDSVKIGTYGVGSTYYSNRSLDRDALFAHLSNILTPEQYQQYLEKTNNRRIKK